VRIQQCAGGKDASHTVLTVRQLSGDLVIHMDSPAGKKEVESQKSWVEGNLPKRRGTEKDLAGHYTLA
jgi:hypothetical protein